MLRASGHVDEVRVQAINALSAAKAERNVLFWVRGIDDLRSSVWTRAPHAVTAKRRGCSESTGEMGAE